LTRPFRFGVVAPLTTDLPTWRERVRRIADGGYSTLLMPDVPQWQPAPGPTLALAAALANLRARPTVSLVCRFRIAAGRMQQLLQGRRCHPEAWLREDPLQSIA